jgi:adenylate kinase family enzyme
MRAQRIAIVSTASGCGKTTLGRALAETLGARFIELDALVHGPNWVETPDDVLREKLAPMLEEERWVVDGNYRQKIGDLVISRADLVIWLDLPIQVWLPRLVRRTLVRAAKREVLWNGNRESLRDAFWGRDSLVGYALRTYRTRRAEWPTALGPYPHVRLQSAREVSRFFEDITRGDRESAHRGRGPRRARARGRRRW